MYGDLYCIGCHRPFEWNSIKGTTDGMYVCPRCMIDRSPDGVWRVWKENPTPNVEAPYPQR